MNIKILNKIMTTVLVLTTFSVCAQHGGDNGANTCTFTNIPNLSTPSAVFSAMTTLGTVKFEPNLGNTLGEVDPYDATKNIKKFNLVSNLQVAALGSSLAVLRPNRYIFNPDLIQNHAISALSSSLVSDNGASTPQGLYTVALFKSWLESLEPEKIYEKIEARKLDGVRILKRTQLSETKQIALSAASNNCSHFLAISKGSKKSLKCVNNSPSVVSCETGTTGFVCLQASIPKKIGSIFQIMVKTDDDQLPIQSWVNELNELQVSSQQSTDTIIQERMLFYKDSEDSIQCASEVSSAFSQVTTVTVHNSKNYIKIPRDDCGSLYRAAAFNTNYSPITLTTVSQDFMDSVDGVVTNTGSSGASYTPLTDMGLDSKFSVVQASPAQYSLNEYKSIAGLTSNTEFIMDPNSNLATAAVLDEPASTCNQ
jgi:hypothetical protein